MNIMSSPLPHLNPWLRRLLLSLLALLVLLALMRAGLPFAIKLWAKHWLESQNIEASFGEVEIALLDGHFAINDVSGRNQNEQVFSLARFAVNWQWQPLFEHQAMLDQIEVKSLHMDAALFENGEINIAGLAIQPASADSPLEATQQAATAPWDATIKKILLSDIQLCLSQFADGDKAVLDYCAKLTELNWTGKASFKPSFQSESLAVPPLYAQGTLKIQGVTLHNNQLDLALLNVDSIQLKGIQLETPNNIHIENIAMAKFSALQRANPTSNADAQLLAFEQLNIQPLRLSQHNDLSLGRIEIANLSSYLLIDKQGRTDFKQWLPEKNKASDAKQKQADEDEAQALHFAFDEFSLSSQHIQFVDKSLKETFSVKLHDIELGLSRLDSRSVENFSHVSLALMIDEHGHFKLDADASPLSQRPSLKGKGEIAGLDLRTYAPLTKQHIGHNIKSGQLDAELKLGIEKGIIDSNMALTLNQFLLESLSDEEAEALNSELGFPLNSSLSLLRDRDNAIRLDIPITGDIENPEFNPKDAIIKASSSAITAAVLHYYTPFGLVFAAESLFDLATALNFEPVIFDPGTAVLNNVHKQQLDKTASLMSQRPGIHLSLCGISNIGDKEKRLPKLEKEQAEPAPPPLSKEAIASLKALAQSRSSNIKTYLINEKKIKASRLIECSPEYLEKEIAGVKISI